MAELIRIPLEFNNDGKDPFLANPSFIRVIIDKDLSILQLSE